MHKFIFIAALFGLLSAGCSGIKVPDDFAYKEIETRDFKLASWQKISEPDGVYKFYIEGDGHAFDSRGRPTADPTPQGTMLRELAFGDPSPNVIYLAPLPVHNEPDLRQTALDHGALCTGSD